MARLWREDLFVLAILAIVRLSNGASSRRGPRRIIRGATHSTRIRQSATIFFESESLDPTKPRTLKKENKSVPPSAQASPSPTIQPSPSPTTRPSAPPTIQPSSSPTFEPQSSNAEVDGLEILMTIKNMPGEEASNDSGIGMLVALAGGGLIMIFLIVYFVGQKNKSQEEEEEEEEEVLQEDEECQRSSSLDKDDDRMRHDAECAHQPIDLSGVYKMVENINFDVILGIAGVPWAVRSAAIRARPTHSILHKGNLFTMKFKGIPRATYIISGPAVESTMRDKKFRCTASYMIDDYGVQLVKRPLEEQPLEEDYELHLCWRLSEDKVTVTLAWTAHFANGREPVESVQVYKRIE